MVGWAFSGHYSDIVAESAGFVRWAQDGSDRLLLASLALLAKANVESFSTSYLLQTFLLFLDIQGVFVF